MARSNSHKRHTLVDILGFNSRGQGPAVGDSHATLRDKFFATSDVSHAKALFHQRFNIDPSDGSDPSNVVAWDVAGLRKMWEALERLPKHDLQHVKLTRITRVAKMSTEGAGAGYSEAQNEIVIVYDAASLKVKKTGKENGSVEPGDPLYGFNAILMAVDHEVGHSADARSKYSESFNPAQWRTHHWNEIVDIFVDRKAPADATREDVRRLLEAIGFADLSLGGDMKVTLRDRILHPDNWLPKRDYGDKMVVSGAMLAIRDAARALGLIRDIDAFTTDVPDVAAIDAFLANPAVASLLAVLQRPFLKPNGDAVHVEIDGRFYHLWGGKLYSYDGTDRPHKVSNYQYASPEEWFAEHYAAFQNDAARAWMKANDPYVYDFFATFVDAGVNPTVPEGSPLLGPRPPLYTSASLYALFGPALGSS